jgi:hypothetical protein
MGSSWGNPRPEHPHRHPQRLLGRTGVPRTQALHQGEVVDVRDEQPGCGGVFWDRERLWIDVEGTSGCAEVRKYLAKGWAGPGAY